MIVLSLLKQLKNVSTFLIGIHHVGLPYSILIILFTVYVFSVGFYVPIRLFCQWLSTIRCCMYLQSLVWWSGVWTMSFCTSISVYSIISVESFECLDIRVCRRLIICIKNDNVWYKHWLDMDQCNFLCGRYLSTRFKRQHSCEALVTMNYELTVELWRRESLLLWLQDYTEIISRKVFFCVEKGVLIGYTRLICQDRRMWKAVLLKLGFSLKIRLRATRISVSEWCRVGMTERKRQNHRLGYLVQ